MDNMSENSLHLMCSLNSLSVGSEGSSVATVTLIQIHDDPKVLVPQPLGAAHAKGASQKQDIRSEQQPREEEKMSV